MLVIGAHSADFVWRAAGTIAVHTSTGGSATIISLSYGERGESGELWKTPNQTEENVKAIRQAEAEKAARAIGAEFSCLDLGDYPLVIDDHVIYKIRDVIREIEPNIILTHPALDPFNPDHPVAHEAVRRARLLTTGSGVASAFDTIAPAEFLVFEPHQPDLCDFVPTTFVDITSAMDAKQQAMEAMEAQSYLREYYRQRAEHRANHARKFTGDATIRFAEAFQRITPKVVKAL